MSGASSGSTVNMYISFLGSFAGSSKMSPYKGMEMKLMRESERQRATDVKQRAKNKLISYNSFSATDIKQRAILRLKFQQKFDKTKQEMER